MAVTRQRRLVGRRRAAARRRRPRARLGAGLPPSVDVVLDGNRAPDLAARRRRTRRVLRAASCRASGRRPLLVAARRTDGCGPIRRRATSLTARTGRRRSSIRTAFAWTDASWRGIEPQRAGRSTRCTSARSRPKAPGGRRPAQLDALADLGITVVEMMPIADFPGRFGWGYDGVNLYAPDAALRHARRSARVRRSRARARPRRDPRRRLQPRRPRRQLPGGLLAGLLHRPLQERLGPGDQLRGAARRRATFFVENAGYWIDEFHFDGLRLDATQDIHDASPEHVIADDRRSGAREAARTRADLPRRRERAAGHEPRARARSQGGYGARRAVERRLPPHRGRRADRAARGLLPRLPRARRRSSSLARKYGYLYQGQWYRWQKQRRGTPALDLPPNALRHLSREPRSGGQLRRSAGGCTSCASPARLRALTALTLLGPATPMLFQGQEFAASAPFLYFADHKAGAARSRSPQGAGSSCRSFRA